MKALNLTQLFTILAKSPEKVAAFKRKLYYAIPAMQRLFKLLSTSEEHTITETRTVYQYVFEEEDYNKDKLSHLRSHLREDLSAFLRLHNYESTAAGQNINAEFYEQHGHKALANKSNKLALRMAEKEAEDKKWLASFQAHKALHLRGGNKQLEKAQHQLLLFFLVSFQKLSIEQLTIFRIGDNKGPINETTRLHIANVLKLLPAAIPSIIDIQTKAIGYFESPSFEQYKAFKAVFMEKIDLVESDKKDFLIFLLNAIVLYPNPSENMIYEYLPLYKKAIESELFTYDDDLGIKSVCNVLGVADFLGDYKLTKLAEEKLIPLLTDEKEKLWCEKLAEISILHGERKLEEALKKIEELDGENVRCFDVTLRKNLLRLKCSYDISVSRGDAYKTISEARSNFKKLLIRNVKNKNMNPRVQKHHNNFINFLLMICNANTEKYTKAYLREKLANYKGEIMETKWLKEKIVERSY